MRRVRGSGSEVQGIGQAARGDGTASCGPLSRASARPQSGPYKCAKPGSPALTPLIESIKGADDGAHGEGQTGCAAPPPRARALALRPGQAHPGVVRPILPFVATCPAFACAPKHAAAPPPGQSDNGKEETEVVVEKTPTGTRTTT